MLQNYKIQLLKMLSLAGYWKYHLVSFIVTHVWLNLACSMFEDFASALILLKYSFKFALHCLVDFLSSNKLGSEAQNVIHCSAHI